MMKMRQKERLRPHLVMKTSGESEAQTEASGS
jgi:hypothetical protein